MSETREWQTGCTAQELSHAIDRLGNSALRIKAERDGLLEVCKAVLAELDDRYDVDQPIGERAKEYPFNGAGELMRKLRAAIDKAEGR